MTEQIINKNKITFIFDIIMIYYYYYMLTFCGFHLFSMKSSFQVNFLAQ